MAGKAPIIPNAVMLDRVMAEIQDGLIENLSWLDVAFGRSQRLAKMVEGKRYIYPSVYCGGWNGHGYNDYIEVSPDSKIGNFSFFEIDDPQTLDGEVWASDIFAPYSLIVWCDLRKVYNQNDNRNTEKIKADILKILHGRANFHLTNGRISVSRIYERAENVYRGYTLDETINQFLMHPYYAFRFEGVLEVPELCE